MEESKKKLFDRMINLFHEGSVQDVLDMEDTLVGLGSARYESEEEMIEVGSVLHEAQLRFYARLQGDARTIYKHVMKRSARDIFRTLALEDPKILENAEAFRASVEDTIQWFQYYKKGDSLAPFFQFALQNSLFTMLNPEGAGVIQSLMDKLEGLTAHFENELIEEYKEQVKTFGMALSCWVMYMSFERGDEQMLST